jgi:DNA-binding HxlR family transcriptional regulator
MGWEGVSESLCPITRALSVVGDRWTLLIMRELMLDVRRFDDLQAQTGMSSSLLANRLQRMESDGLIERRLYNERPKRYEYHATEMGLDLDPLILMLRSWGLKNRCNEEGYEFAATLVHRETGETIDADWRPPSDAPPFRFTDTDVTMNPGWAAERAANLEAFQSGKSAKLKRRKEG